MICFVGCFLKASSLVQKAWPPTAPSLKKKRGESIPALSRNVHTKKAWPPTAPSRRRGVRVSQPLGENVWIQFGAISDLGTFNRPCLWKRKAYHSSKSRSGTTPAHSYTSSSPSKLLDGTSHKFNLTRKIIQWINNAINQRGCATKDQQLLISTLTFSLILHRPLHRIIITH
jgi:hypothetical protein